VEQRLLQRVPARYLVDAHHWLILHGRYVCQARKPQCDRCAVRRWCDLGPPPTIGLMANAAVDAQSDTGCQRLHCWTGTGSAHDQAA
jgi:adenine-specific DNA glycosylase